MDLIHGRLSGDATIVYQQSKDGASCRSLEDIEVEYLMVHPERGPEFRNKHLDRFGGLRNGGASLEFPPRQSWFGKAIESGGQ